MDARAVARRIVDEVLADFAWRDIQGWGPQAIARFGPKAEGVIIGERLRRQEAAAWRAQSMFIVGPPKLPSLLDVTTT